MAINTYGTLKTAVANYLNRSDLTSLIPDFITLGSARMWYGGDDPYPSQPVRIPAMQNQDTGSVSGGYIAFPDLFLEPIKLSASDGSTSWTLDYASNANSDLPNQQTASSYTYLGNAIYTGISTATTYTLDFYKAFAAFSADADTNWILTNAPNVYLYSALVESAPFIGDDPRLAVWFGLYRSSVNSLNKSTKRQGSGLAVRCA